jgi:ubiquitin carboxyl-terminal hydrolase 10
MSDTASAPSRRQSTVTNVLFLPPETRTPYYPNVSKAVPSDLHHRANSILQLPWYSPDASPSAFPPRANARRKRQNLTKSNDTVALPSLSNASNEVQQSEASPELATSVNAEEPVSEASTVAATSARETPATSQAPSESDFPQVSTPTTPAPATAATSSPKTPNASAQQHTRKDTRTAIAVPNVGALPKAKAITPSTEKQTQQPSAVSGDAALAQAETAAVDGTAEPAPAEAPRSPPKPVAPKSWADLVRTKEAKTASAAQANGAKIQNSAQSVPKSAPLAEALRQHTVTDDILSFLEPRGLVNPGNMCYMNSVSSML